jgi:hypothetical protein
MILKEICLFEHLPTDHYRFGPFGDVIRMTGPMAKVNPFRFSTKYQDDETDLLYYGTAGRWVSHSHL